MYKRYKFYILIILSLFLTYRTVKDIQGIADKKFRFTDLKQELYTLKEKNAVLEKEVEYLKTEDFLIKEAQRKLNFVFEGEQMVILPKETPTE